MAETKYINPNILNEGNHMEVLDTSEFEKTFDELDLIVKCNNCGQPTKFGKTRMCSGFVGCDNKIVIDGEEKECYFDDLMPRVVEYKNNQYEKYRERKVYRFRDGNTEYYGK